MSVKKPGFDYAEIKSRKLNKKDIEYRRHVNHIIFEEDVEIVESEKFVRKLLSEKPVRDAIIKDTDINQYLINTIQSITNVIRAELTRSVTNLEARCVDNIKKISELTETIAAQNTMISGCLDGFEKKINLLDKKIENIDKLSKMVATTCIGLEKTVNNIRQDKDIVPDLVTI